MTTLNDLFDLELLYQMIEQGYVREQTHPEFPQLRILNYSEKVQFEKVWNDVTRACRGLIYNADSMRVLARPFSKFHNWDEAEAPKIMSDQIVYDWSNKFDGSLGIGYVRPDGVPAIATRGSFASDQAIHATELLWQNEGAQYELGLDIIDNYNDGYTLLFEIIYPENRIVLDYGDVDELVPIGVIEISSGAFVKTTAPELRTFHQLLMDLSRENAEGWVVWVNAFKAVKIKQADYVELHRIVTGLNRKSIWRGLRDGTLGELLPQLPDELYAWATETAQELLKDHSELWTLVVHSLSLMIDAVGIDGERRDQAVWIQTHVPKSIQGLVFQELDGKNISGALWRMLEPVGDAR